jgi:hypothetical protein
MNQGLREIHRCEVCGGSALKEVLNLGHHPMCDDLVAVGDARICREYPIEILFCADCVTAHQRYQVPKHELFPVSYHYRSRFTADVLNGMRSLVEGCEQRFGCLAKKTVLDIGCNDGSLLGFFREKGARTIGIEPTGAVEDAKLAGHEVYADYLSPDVASDIVRSHGYPDIITFTNVFAHIEDLDGVLASLRCLMADNTVVVIENHYLGSVLAGNQFDTFYHEHPRTYSYKSFSRMAAKLGANILEVDFPSRYGGNIRVSFGRVSAGRALDLEKARAVERREAGFGDAFSVLRTNVERWRSIKSDEIRTLYAKYGNLRAKAFPGRAAILVKLLGLDEEMISAVYEKPGSLKVGHYLPGTRIEIHSDDELFSLSDQTQPILNLAWHIPTEIRTYLAAHGYSGEVVDVLSAEDFR